MNARLGDYVLEAELGRGGMGRVFRARHLGTGAIRAVKVLEHAGDVEAILRFRREAEALARVGGRFAVTIHESGTQGGRFYFVMELMPGGSLRERIGRTPWQEAAALGAKVARALAALHAAGLVHRDLKPENVLFGDDGEPRLADLGCVRDVASASLTASGTVLGTLSYMAPEQLEGARVDGAADVYAFGTILVELVSGRPLFSGSLFAQLEARRKVGATLSEALARARPLEPVVAAMLAADPHERPAALALAERLEALASGNVERRGGGRLALVGTVGLLATGLVALALVPVRRAEEATPVGPSPSPRATPSVPPVHGDVARILELARRGAGTLTSVDVSLRDVQALAVAGRDDLLERLVAGNAVYASSDLAPLLEAHGSRQLRMLWTLAVLTEGDLAARDKAAARLRASGLRTEIVLATLIERANDLARALADEAANGGEPSARWDSVPTSRRRTSHS